MIMSTLSGSNNYLYLCHRTEPQCCVPNTKPACREMVSTRELPLAPNTSDHDDGVINYIPGDRNISSKQGGR